jgi:hypothetical protein
MAKAAEDQIIKTTAISELSLKVGLFDKRQEFFDKVDDCIEHKMHSWKNDSVTDKLFNNYSDLHILALFDQEVLDFWKYLIDKDSKINKLRGDYEVAENKGSCRGRNTNDILCEIDLCFEELNKKYGHLKGIVLNKYLKL